MKIWKHSRLDFTLFVLSAAQFGATLWLAESWEGSSFIWRIGNFALLVLMIVYNIIVISHLFTHTPWFHAQWLNGLASILNSVNMGQSAQAYQLTHVRNHHRYNNDRKGLDGTTKDLSSTYRDGVGDEHASLFKYAFGGATATLFSTVKTLLSITRLWSIGIHERELLALTSKSPVKRALQLRQLQLDRTACFLMVLLYVAISWKWTLACYLPAFFCALALVNVQNYYRHYGAAPENKYADSVSYYGRIYNLLTFNDGYHQEHHLRPLTHWRLMPAVLRGHEQLNQVERIISPVPAMLGIFHRNRAQLHRRSQVDHSPPLRVEQPAFSTAAKGGVR